MDALNTYETEVPSTKIAGKELSADEIALLRDVIRSLRYGSVNLTVHEGRLVEIQKIEKIRINDVKVAV